MDPLSFLIKHEIVVGAANAEFLQMTFGSAQIMDGLQTAIRAVRCALQEVKLDDHNHFISLDLGKRRSARETNAVLPGDLAECHWRQLESLDRA
jgi:hypothetical protein